MITATVEADSSLLLEPACELRFSLDRARRSARSVLTLSNVSLGADVAFKVRTRSPDVFAVKPTHGLLRAGGSAQVAISVAPRSVARLAQMRPEDLEARRSSDLFLIQSVELTPDMRLAKTLAAPPSSQSPRSPTTEALRAFWKQVPREVVDEHKLACRFVVARGGPPPVATNAAASSFLRASQSMERDWMATARESFASQSTVYEDCLSQAGDACQPPLDLHLEQELGIEREPARGPRAVDDTSDRLSRSRLSASNRSVRDSRRDRRGEATAHAVSTSGDAGGRTSSSSELNRENLRRLSGDSSSWISAACGSPTSSAASAAYDDCRSMTSTMLESNASMLSARSSALTADAAVDAAAAPAASSSRPPSPSPSPSLLFSIHPHDVLKFEVKRAPRYWASSSFFIVNASQTDCLAFKVRTTNQDGYLLQPSRGLVAVTSAQKVEVHLCAPREGFVRRPAREARDAFLVEVAALSPAQYGALAALDGRRRSRELSALWSVLPPSDRHSEMLTVELAADPADEDDVFTPVQSHVVSMGTPSALGSRSRAAKSAGRSSLASGESTDGRRRGEGGSGGGGRGREGEGEGEGEEPDRPPTTSAGGAATKHAQAVVVMSPDAMDLVDFSDPEVSFFV